MIRSVSTQNSSASQSCSSNWVSKIAVKQEFKFYFYQIKRTSLKTIPVVPNLKDSFIWKVIKNKFGMKVLERFVS